jgi:hypothetical protein
MSARLALAAAVLCTLAGPAAAQPSPRADKPISPDGTDVLAEGPLEVTVDWDKLGKKYKADCTLLFLTRKAFYLRDASGDVYPCAVDSGSYAYGRAMLIETRGPVPVGKGESEKRFWSRDLVPGTDPRQYRYAGKPLPPAAIDLTPLAVDEKRRAAVENWLLYCALEQLQSRVDTALLSGDEPLAKACAEQTKRVVAYLTAAPGADKTLRTGYEDLAGYLESQVKNRLAVRKLFEDQAGQIKNLQQQALEAQGRLMQSQAALARNPFALFGGASTLSRAMSAFEQERKRIELAVSALGGRAKEQLESLAKEFEAARKGRWTAIRTIGVDRYGLPLEAPFEVLRGLGEKADPKDVIALLEKRVEVDRRFGKDAGAGDNPFALRDLYAAQSGTIKAADEKRGAALFDLARQTVEAARLLPAGRAFDFERADLLRSAAALACLAATAEARTVLARTGGAWSQAFSPRAAYALRLLELSGALDGTGSLAAADPTAQLREQRAVALLLVGQAEEAYQQAKQIEKLREESRSALSRVNLARLLLAREKTTDADRAGALRHLVEAFKGGFGDVQEIWGGPKPENLRPDFLRLNSTKDKKLLAERNELFKLARAAAPH